MSRILVVEDDVLLNGDIAYELEAANHEVCRAYSGEEAVQHLTQHAATTNLVISDNNMGGMTGFELLALIKSRHPHIKAMMVSGSKPENIDAVADAFLMKPTSSSNVAAHAGRLLAPRTS